MKFKEVIKVPAIPNAVSYLSAYLTEAISIIGALIYLGAAAENGRVIMDCESLYKAIQTFTKAQSGPIDSHLTDCPYVATIHNLVFNRGIKFIWVRSHRRKERSMSISLFMTRETTLPILQLIERLERWRPSLELTGAT